MATPAPVLNNAQAQAILTNNALRMLLPLPSQTVNANNTPVITFTPRPTGVLLGFIVEVTGPVTNGATTQANRTGFGSANAVRNFTFSDLDNVQRINTSGAHIAMLNSAKQGWVMGGAYASNIPMGFGNNWSPFSAPVSIAAAGTGTITHTYYVPVAYGANDLRGAIYLNTTGANANLAITLSTSAQLGVATGQDPLNAVYIDNDNLGWTNNVTVNVYQDIYDQIPVSSGVPVLPWDSMSQIYDIKQSTLTGLSQGQEFPIAYTNFREFQSTMVVFDNGGTYNVGNDVGLWSLRAANSANIWSMSANIAALQARQTFMADPPAGVYYFDHRARPINTITYGNMELILTPTTVNANAQLVVYFEAFQRTNVQHSATSLPAG